jgi:hypothetical protein
MLRRRVVVRRGIGVLGAAAIGGTAYALGRGKRKQQVAAAQAEQIYQPSAPIPAPEVGNIQDKKITQLKELAELQKSGILSPEEFEKEKKKILEQ